MTIQPPWNGLDLIGIEDPVQRGSICLHTAAPFPSRASIHLEHGEAKCHIGVVFDTETNEHNQAERIEALKAALRALMGLRARVGQTWEGASILHFPGDTNAPA